MKRSTKVDVPEDQDAIKSTTDNDGRVMGVVAEYIYF